jgi:hypothetical protein
MGAPDVHSVHFVALEDDFRGRHSPRRGEDTVMTSDTLGTNDESDTASPLAQLMNLPEYVANKQLTANQQRARFVAKDVLDYADNTPKGYVVDSATVSKVLAVRDGESPHTETVSWTMDFLDSFGKSEVETRMHKGDVSPCSTPNPPNDTGPGPSPHHSVV